MVLMIKATLLLTQTSGWQASQSTTIWSAEVVIHDYVNKLLYLCVTVYNPNMVGRSQSGLLLSIIVTVTH